MQHITLPVSELMRLIVNPDEARISGDSTHMLAIVDDTFHILVGDFTGIETSEDLSEILRRNL
jgi:hypothetical protein